MKWAFAIPTKPNQSAMLCAVEFFERADGIVQTLLTSSALRQQAKEHSAVDPSVLFRERHQEPLELDEAELAGSWRLREAKVAKAPRWIALKPDFKASEARSPAEEDFKFGD